MLVPWILGFHGVLFVSVVAFCLVIRHKWRDVAERKDEVMRLLAIASGEAALAEVQASAEYSSLPKVFQCAVCFRPTTTRCAQCKAVRYCSGKCQISHWRQGHKDECHSVAVVMDFKEGIEFDGKSASQKQFELYGRDSDIPKFKMHSEAPSLVVDDDNLKPFADAKGTHTGFALSSNLSLAGFTSYGGSESSVKVSHNEVLGSNAVERPENHHSIDTAHGMPGISPSIKIPTRSPPLESTNRVNCEDNVPHVRKLNKKKSIYHDEEVDFKSPHPKDKTAMFNDIQPERLGNKRSISSDSSEMLVTGTFEFKNSPSSNTLRSDSVTNDEEADSKLMKGKKVRSLTFSSSGDIPSPTTGAHAVTGSKSVLPAKVSSIASLPKNANNGLKTSVKKVVQQFRASKLSKSYLLGSGNEVTGKYTNKVIFPYELFIKLYSCDGVELCPFGLTNCGNSCYANAVLQCLAFTRPLTSYLVRGLHSKSCRKEWCFICEFECLILKAREGKSPLSPIRILSKLQKIGRHLGPGREEDAHEFLRYAVDTMQSVCLKEAEATSRLAEETTIVGLTFGGYLRSKIKCMNCLGKSERSERMMDLTVEIDGDIGSLEEALAQFTATEILDGENRYHCSRCRSYEKAKKKLAVLEAPNILTIVLKRFQSGNFGKLNKSVRFPEVLDMAPYMSGTSDKSPIYNLYAVVVHLDVMNTAFSGHYVCYVKNFHGEWFRIDDSTVVPVELENVLLEGAYILLYARHSPRAPALVRNSMESHGARSKKRNLETVPSSHNESKLKSNFSVPSVEPFTAKWEHKYPYWMTFDGPNHSSDSDDRRFHLMRRIPAADSSSESSSLFSFSDTSSCSTASTKDSSPTEDFSDYLFGEVGPSWYSHYGISSDTVASSSLQSVNADLKEQKHAWVPPNQGHEWREDLEGDGNPAILYTESTNHRRHLSTQFVNSSRDTWANPYDVRSGISSRRASGDGKAQTFY